MKAGDIISTLFYLLLLPGIVGALLGSLVYGLSNDLSASIIYGVAVAVGMIVMVIVIPAYMMSHQSVSDKKSSEVTKQ